MLSIPRHLTIRKKLFHFIGFRCFFRFFPWRFLRYFPPQIPEPESLRQYTQSHIDNYQQWLKRCALNTVEDWLKLRKKATTDNHPSRFSIVTPVFNTDPAILKECINSVCIQAYPYWQLILVDDYSSSDRHFHILREFEQQDVRIKVIYAKKSLGIADATNLAIDKARGDFILFLDHDDRLAPDALYYLAEAIAKQPDTDILYSDRDMITPDGNADMHLFKPDWSPETLLSGNYIFHLMCYRRRLLNDLGGLRAEFDGSQDYDLILRAAETQPKVQHIPRVLYHWRQHETSVALNVDSKNYAFDAGVSALNQALARRGINGTASEIKSLWRGNYQLKLHYTDRDRLAVINLADNLPEQNYAQFVSHAIKQLPDKYTHVAILSDNIKPQDDYALFHLACWLTMPQVAMASPRIDSQDHFIHYSGMIYRTNATLCMTYQGFPSTEAGYMAATRITRNIRAVHPYCVVMRIQSWQELDGFDPEFSGSDAMLDLCLRASQQNWRSVVVPQYRFITSKPAVMSDEEFFLSTAFKTKWQDYLQLGDPYSNPNLNEQVRHMGELPE